LVIDFMSEASNKAQCPTKIPESFHKFLEYGGRLTPLDLIDPDLIKRSSAPQLRRHRGLSFYIAAEAL
jgi:hypothetical protein